jgi:succinyl-CoA synthetase beta subunit
MLTEPESLSLLSQFGVAIAETREVETSADAVSAADAIGYPVALKGVVQGVAHKSEAGLIRLGLNDAAAVRDAFESMGTPRAIVQAMRRGDIEAMVGVSRSADVGLVLVAGLGGVFVESLRQTVSWALPVDRESVARRLDASPLGRVLLSARWRHPGSRDALIDAIMSVQEFALQAGDLIEAAEINPLVIGGDGVIAVDGLVIPAKSELDVAA